MSISEKCAYIKGLAEGLNLDNTKPEARLISELINIIEDLIDVIDDIEEDVEELEEYVEELDHDLGDVESYVFECDDDECDCCDCDDCDDEDCDCGCHYEDCENCEGCDDDCECEDCEGCLMEEYYEAQCPNCGEIICFDVDMDTEDMVCPACNKPFIEEDEE